MRKLMLLSAAALMLTTTGIALARGLDDGKSIRPVAATFGATVLSKSHTSTCTTTDGKTLTTTKATYTGTATGDPDLTGPVSLDVRSTINVTDGVGVLDGKVKIGAAGGDTVVHLDAVYDHGTVAGLVSGHAKSPHVKVLGNVSASFAAATGFAPGAKIGGGTAGGAAVVIGPGKCAPVPKPPKPAPQTSEAKGTLTTLPTTTSITVSGLTCTIPPNLLPRTSALKVGDTVEIKCSLVNGVNTLTKVETKGKKK